MNTVTILLICFSAILIILVINYLISTYNTLKVLEENISKAEGNVDVLLNQRYDEVKSLLKVIKKYVNYEEDIIQSMISVLDRYSVSNQLMKKFQVSSEIVDSLDRVQKLVDRIPELQSSKNYMQLQDRISEIEMLLADRYELYNDSVFLLNANLKIFPRSIIGKFAGLTRRELFKVDDNKKDIDGLLD